MLFSFSFNFFFKFEKSKIRVYEQFSRIRAKKAHPYTWYNSKGRLHLSLKKAGAGFAVENKEIIKNLFLIGIVDGASLDVIRFLLCTLKLRPQTTTLLISGMCLVDLSLWTHPHGTSCSQSLWTHPHGTSCSRKHNYAFKGSKITIFSLNSQK